MRMWLLVLSLTSGPVLADDEVKTMGGMSVLGNNEAPKSLVIVPWKSSELGDGLRVRNLVDDRANPLDKDVFLRELNYYQIRTRTDRQVGSRD